MQDNPSSRLPTLSVVMPCLNEEKNVADAIQSTLQVLDDLGIVGEIVVVNDGSDDNTGNIVAELQKADSRIHVVTHPQRQGIGASFRDGVEQARHDFVTMLPGDNENDPYDSLRYFYLAKDIDIIVPFIMNVEVRSKTRRFISSLYRLIINMTFGLNLNYTNGTVIYNRIILKDIELKTTGFLYQAEILIKLIRMGYFYAETPHLLSQRGGGKTKALTFRSLSNVIGSYVDLLWEIHITQRAGRTDIQLNPESKSYQRYQTK